LTTDLLTPWSGLARATIDTCEPDLAGWIVHPIETISALAYLFVAARLWRRYRLSDRALPARWLPAIVGLVGGASLLFHASFRAWFQIVDLATICLFTGFMLATASVHLGTVSQRWWPSIAMAISATGIIAPLLHIGVGFAMVAAQISAVLWIWRQLPLGDATRPAHRAVWPLLIGTPILGLDHAGVGCLGGDLAHIIQPHAVWHLLSATSVWYFCSAERLLERRWAS
jgi:hypothetical protein